MVTKIKLILSSTVIILLLACNNKKVTKYRVDKTRKNKSTLMGNKSGKFRALSAINENTQQENNTKKFILQIDGVECSLCAQSVVDQLKTIEGIEHVEYVVDNYDYEHGHLLVTWAYEDKNIDTEHIKSSIECQGFNLASIREES